MYELNILGLSYDVEEVEFIDRDKYVMGRIDFDNQKILLLKNLKPDKKMVTLIHEVIHAINFNIGHQEHETEEMVQGLAVSLHQIFKQNKEVFIF